MSQPTLRPPSVFSLAWLFGNIAYAAISRAITYPCRTNRAASFRKDVLYAAIRTMLCHITIPQTRYLNASTTQRYLNFCKARNQEPDTVKAEANDVKVVAHWVGDSKADTVIVYFHGGSYFQPATDGVFLYLNHLITELNASKDSRSIAALVVAYSLAPEATHPTQLKQAAAILNHLLTTAGRSPSDIFLSGDSAGGTFALGLLSHSMHPHPKIDLIELQKPLAGVVIYSPCVTFHTDYPSFERNEYCDMLPSAKLQAWAEMFLGNTDPHASNGDQVSISGDAYSEPCLNTPSWWQGMHRVVSHVLVLSGGDEVLADPILKLCESMKKGWSEGGGKPESVTFMETPREAHIGPIVDFMISGGRGTKSDSQRMIDAWYKARLGS